MNLIGRDSKAEHRRTEQVPLGLRMGLIISTQRPPHLERQGTVHCCSPLTNAKYLALHLHMYGEDMGTLKVETRSYKDGQFVSSWVTRHEESGNKGDVCRNVIVDLGPGDKQVILIAVRGSGWSSDIASDSLTLVT